MEEFDFHSLLIIDTHFLTPVGAAQPQHKANTSSVVPLLRSSYLCLCLPRVSFRALPSFHPGL